MITVCMTYFRSLTLANLAAALYSVRRQDLSRVKTLLLVDNDTDDDPAAIHAQIDALDFPVPVSLRSHKHSDRTLTHAWSTNVAVRAAETPWIFFTRADYLLEFSAIAKFTMVVDAQPTDWNGFVTSNGRHLHGGIVVCEQSSWRRDGPHVLSGVDFDYTCIDAGVWMANRDAIKRAGGLDERLSAWGHAQTLFQYRLHSAGTECVRIHETLFFHPQHGGERDLSRGHEQLAAIGVDVKQLWDRHEGAKPY